MDIRPEPAPAKGAYAEGRKDRVSRRIVHVLPLGRWNFQHFTPVAQLDLDSDYWSRGVAGARWPFCDGASTRDLTRGHAIGSTSRRKGAKGAAGAALTPLSASPVGTP